MKLINIKHASWLKVTSKSMVLIKRKFLELIPMLGIILIIVLVAQNA